MKTLKKSSVHVFCRNNLDYLIYEMPLSRNLKQLLILSQTRSEQKCLSKYGFYNCPMNLRRNCSLCILYDLVSIISPSLSLFLVTLLFLLVNLCFVHISYTRRILFSIYISMVKLHVLQPYCDYKTKVRSTRIYGNIT